MPSGHERPLAALLGYSAMSHSLPSNPIQIRSLTKTYSSGYKALNGVNLDIPMGMFGLLGPNGAGKSSLMRTIATLQEASAGTIQWGDINERVKKGLGLRYPHKSAPSAHSASRASWSFATH
jgi:ABC-type polysaccharide/polyol phosphate transport system ATPase subunit